MRENDEVRMTNDQIEHRLAEFVPAPHAIDRDALLYRAGYNAACGLAASQRSVRLWQTTTALATAASVALAFALWQQPSPQPLPQMVEAPQEEAEQLVEHAPPVAEPTPVIAREAPRIDPLLYADPSSNYFALRATILEHGVDAWPVEQRTYSIPASDTERSQPPTVRRLMEEMLPPAKPHEPEHRIPNEASNRSQESVV